MNKLICRKLICLGTALLLVACGAEEPDQTTRPAVEPETAAEQTAPATAGETDAADEAIEVVEESAAEPEAGEQTILLAQADAPAGSQTESRTWRFNEGQHYERMVPTQPTVGGADKVEVAEFFWYGCPHCNDVEPYVNRWAESKPASVRFVRIPAMWNGLLQLHARLFYTQEVLARNGVIKDGPAFHAAVFQEYHGRGNRLSTETAIQRFFERFGVSAEDFEKTWNSFEVAQKLRVAEDLARRYSIASVPTFVVNGKYRTGGQMAGSYPRLFEIIDELIARENAR